VSNLPLDPTEAARAAARKKRDSLIDKLLEEGATDLAERLEKCGELFGLTCTNCGERHEAEKRCDLKWCPACQRALATRTSMRYAEITKAAKWPLFVTWTVQNFDDPSFDFVRSVRRAHTKMRRLRWFKKAVVGGVGSIEVTNTGNGWHPHVHNLLDCRWLAVTEQQPRIGATREKWKRTARAVTAELAQQWSLCLGRPGSVKVRRVFGHDKRDSAPITTEVLKYSCKGGDLLECKEPIAPLIRMLDASRLVVSWGSFYGHASTKRVKHPSMCRCGKTGSLIPDKAVDWMMRSQR
jgi:Replication protein